MHIKKSYFLFLFLICSAFFGKKTGLFEYPEYFPKPVYNFSNNPLTKNKIQLGRALFYDPILSQDSTISCASCHSPYNAFAHTDHDLSHGIGDAIGTRNAPALFNLAWQKSFMWDGAINHLDMQALAPISHPKEMDETIENVVQKIQNKKMYAPLFEAAFQDGTVTGERVLKALSQFQLTLVSANSKYDEVKNETATFSQQEKNGYQLFLKNCNSCHTEPLFSNNKFANNGLLVDTTLNDFGKWMITKKSTDSLQFKIPTLRNLKYTFPYMHDGRFRRLNEVLNHYSNNILPNSTLAPELQNNLSQQQRGIALTGNEKADLIAFLLTLNDAEFVFSKKNNFPREVFFPEK